MKSKILIGLVTLGILSFAGYKLYPVFSATNNNLPVTPQPGPEAPVPQDPIFAVVVENYPDARPKSGLLGAKFVFETTTEAGITRFLAFYYGQIPDTIGPVRSARPYFVDWASGFDAILAHSGGSVEGLQKIEALEPSFQDLNEFYNEKYFRRNPGRKAPHNLFTAGTLLKQAATDKLFETKSVDAGWINKADSPLATSTVSQVDIDFSFPAYYVSFRYNSESNSYDRFLQNKPDIDASVNVQISPKNVVVLYSSSTVIDQNLLTINLVTLGSNRAVIFRDGQIINARWKKDSTTSPLKLLEADNSLIELNNGQTWFAVVAQNGVVTWK